MSVLVMEKGEGSGFRFRFQPKWSKFGTVVHMGPKKIIRNKSDTIFLFFYYIQ